MKCPHCWSEKAYLHHFKGWRRFVLPWLLLVPMKCQHCYKEFAALWFATLGQQTKPPKLRTVGAVIPRRQSYAARHYADQQPSRAVSSRRNEPPQAKAA